MGRTRPYSLPMPEARPRILAAVRERCRWVAGTADRVRVVPDRIGPWADELLAEGLVGPGGVVGGGGAPGDPWSVGAADGDDEAVTALVLALDTINFGSGYHPLVHKREGCSGATTMALGLRDWVAAEGPPTADRLRALTADDAHAIFGQPSDGGALDELMDRFATALADLGRLVGEHHGGSFTALVGAADGSADRLVGLLAALPFFRDEAAYRGTVVPFYKRAQIAAADLDRAFGGRGPGAFDDLDELTAFADNLVPHVLRLDGVLAYDGDLAAAIDAGEPIASGSEAEVQIRAGGVHGVELLRAALAERGVTVRSSDLDGLLWRRGGGARYKTVPRHRTRSVFY